MDSHSGKFQMLWGVSKTELYSIPGEYNLAKLHAIKSKMWPTKVQKEISPKNQRYWRRKKSYCGIHHNSRELAVSQALLMKEIEKTEAEGSGEVNSISFGDWVILKSYLFVHLHLRSGLGINSGLKTIVWKVRCTLGSEEENVEHGIGLLRFRPIRF